MRIYQGIVVLLAIFSLSLCSGYEDSIKNKSNLAESESTNAPTFDTNTLKDETINANSNLESISIKSQSANTIPPINTIISRTKVDSSLESNSLKRESINVDSKTNLAKSKSTTPSILTQLAKNESINVDSKSNPPKSKSTNTNFINQNPIVVTATTTIDFNCESCEFKDANKSTDSKQSAHKIQHKYFPKTKEELIELLNKKEMLNGKEIESVNLGEIDTSKITDMSELFADSERECFNGIETWDTSSVENMRRMFAGASCFNQPLDKWNVSNVRDMQGMFYGTESFNQPLDSWDTGKVVTMMGMFAGAKSFNQNLDSWDISNVRYMNDIFKDSPLQDNPPKWWKK